MRHEVRLPVEELTRVKLCVASIKLCGKSAVFSKRERNFSRDYIHSCVEIEESHCNISILGKSRNRMREEQKIVLEMNRVKRGWDNDPYSTSPRVRQTNSGE